MLDFKFKVNSIHLIFAIFLASSNCRHFLATFSSAPAGSIMGAGASAETANSSFSNLDILSLESKSELMKTMNALMTEQVSSKQSAKSSKERVEELRTQFSKALSVTKKDNDATKSKPNSTNSQEFEIDNMDALLAANNDLANQADELLENLNNSGHNIHALDGVRDEPQLGMGINKVRSSTMCMTTDDIDKEYTTQITTDNEGLPDVHLGLQKNRTMSSMNWADLEKSENTPVKLGSSYSKQPVHLTNPSPLSRNDFRKRRLTFAKRNKSTAKKDMSSKQVSVKPN